MKKRTTTVLKWIGLVIVALGFLYALLLAVSSRSLHRAYAALKADGRPMKAEEVIPANVPDFENAAPVYEAVVLQLRAEGTAEQDLFADLRDLASRMVAKEPDADAAESFAALVRRPEVRSALEMLRRGAEREHCRYDIDYSRGAHTPLPHLSDLRHLSRIVCARACLEADAGNADEAWRDAVTGLRLADALRDEPMLISQLVRIAQFAVTADTLRYVAGKALPTASGGEDLARLLRSFEDPAPWVRGLDGERLLLGEWAFSLPRSALREMLQVDAPSPSTALGHLLAPVLQLDHAAYLRLMLAHTQTAAEAPSREDATREEDLLAMIPRYGVLTRLIVPALSASRSRFAGMVADARVLRAGLAALEYRREAGAFPPQLDTLAGGPFIDSFTGKAVHYRATPSGFVVYSVGPDRVDDGGAAGTKTGAGDIAWHYPAPEATPPGN